MQFKKYFIFTSVAVLLTPSAFAADQNTTDNPPAQNILFCPPFKELKKDPVKLSWSAPHGWKSYGITFISQISIFLGAQWRGATVGQLTCIYRSAEKNTFPVLLISNNLAFEPQTGKWSKNLGGYRNCVAKKQEDCPFQMKIRVEPKNVNEEAEKLKSDSDVPQNPGF